MRLFPLIFLVLFACNTKTKSTIKTHVVAANENVFINYDSCKLAIFYIKRKYKPKWIRIPKKQKEKYFTESIVKTIIPAWVGTTWSFNGVSEKPGEGSIACGYFVTTVLRDAGMPLARIKLAQCASEEMIKTLVQPQYIKRFSALPMSDFINYISQSGYGLYVVGLDNHTGFIFNDSVDIKFIHSTFVGTRNVQIENALTSAVLKSSQYKVIGKISADEIALNKWINKVE